MDKFDALFWKWMCGLIVVLGFCIFMAIRQENGYERKCEAKGGEWHSAYKSKGLCLPKGMVIDVDD